MLHNFCRNGIGLLMTVGLAGEQLRPPQVVILIGPPGSGKSVQAKILGKSYKVPPISMESLLKGEMSKKTPLARILATTLSSGELVGDDAANQVMKSRLVQPDAGRGFILDGYPTTPEQAKALDAFLSDNSFPKPTVVIIEAPDEVLRARMKARKRVDDTPENIERRILEYRQLGKFTENWYGLVNTVRVNGTGTIQNVALAITQQIDDMRSKKGFAVRPQEGGLKKRPPETVPEP